MSRLSSSSLRMKKKKEAEGRGWRGGWWGGLHVSCDLYQPAGVLFLFILRLRAPKSCPFIFISSSPLLLNSPTSGPPSPRVSRLGLISSDPSFPFSFSPFLLFALFLNSSVFFNQILFSLFSLLFPSPLFIVSSLPILIPLLSLRLYFISSPSLSSLPFDFISCHLFLLLPFISFLFSFPFISFLYYIALASFFLSIFLSLYFHPLAFPALFSFPLLSFPFLCRPPFPLCPIRSLFFLLSFNPHLFNFTLPPPLFLVLFLFCPISFPLLEFPHLCFPLFLFYPSLFPFLSPLLPSPPLLSVTPKLCEKKQTSHDFPACLINKDGYVIA